jgi:ATP-dependent helicase/nuclease subunit B
MSKQQPRVFNIPASAPFLPVLLEALLDGRLIEGLAKSGDPLALAAATIYLPTRRACRLIREKFLDIAGTDAAILPRIVAIGDIDEDELVFAETLGPLAPDVLDLPPALGALERRLLLAQLISKWSNAPRLRGAQATPLIANTPSAALGLADDLARLMDDMTTRQVDWAKLQGLVPDALDPYWQFSFDFLKIVQPGWKAILDERGAIESAERRDRMIEAEAERIARINAPVIAAGSTGSMPATARLLATIARQRHGAVVLPGLDTDLDETSWQAIAGNKTATSHDGGTPAAGHPQFAMQALLARIGIGRDAVIPLAPSGRREALVSNALRPAATTDLWQALATSAETQNATRLALGDITLIEAANVEDEALAAAVALREALETPGKTAALVTPDRSLARRVLAALARWNIEADDSGGDALPDTAAGIFARLVADVALGGLAPVALLAMLKHPLLRLGQDAGQWRGAVAALERAILRGPRPKAGAAALLHALHAFRQDYASHTSGGPARFHRSDPRLSIPAADLDAATALAAALAAAIAPLQSAARQTESLAELADRHRQAMVALATDGAGHVAAFSGHDGQMLQTVFDELADSPAAKGLAIAAADYADVFHTIAAGRVVRRPEKPGVRVRIYGPLESRLQSVDRVVLGGLNEGTWPPDIRSDPWLSRPMRHQLGLDLPERRIGLTAHDFAQGIATSDVILTRAAKVAGAPVVTSRFVQRLAAVAGADAWQDVVARGHRYLDWARALDAPLRFQPMERPAPQPALEIRPLKLSVTEIEHWLRDPYTIYAKHILGLLPLDAVDTAPGAADRGSIIHAAIGAFTQKYSHRLPANPVNELLALGERYFAPLADYPEARAFWWPRFLRIAHWFAEWEQSRRPELAAVHGEIYGTLDITIGARTFTLSARADRIERRTDGSYVIADYKTGRIPGDREVKVGLAPQLTLEAAILRQGGFPGIPASGSISQLVYVALKGGQPAGSGKTVKLKDSTPDAEADAALAKLTMVATRFLRDGEPYRSLVSPMWKSRYGDYDHLARVKEWATSGNGEDGE